MSNFPSDAAGDQNRKRVLRTTSEARNLNYFDPILIRFDRFGLKFCQFGFSKNCHFSVTNLKKNFENWPLLTQNFWAGGTPLLNTYFLFTSYWSMTKIKLSRSTNLGSKKSQKGGSTYCHRENVKFSIWCRRRPEPKESASHHKKRQRAHSRP